MEEQKYLSVFKTALRKIAMACTSLIFFIILFITSFPVSLSAETSGIPQKIKVVMDDNYPPFIFRNNEGVLQGILVDEWKLWEKKTGIAVELSAMDWSEAQKRMVAGEYDVIDTLFFSPERAKTYDFSKPYVKIEVSIYFHKDISGIADVKDLAGFMVGVKDGDNVIDVLSAAGITHLQKFESYEAIVLAASQDKIKVFSIDRPPAHYLMHKYRIDWDFKQMGKIIYTGAFHRAVRKGNLAMLQTVERGFGMISAGEHKKIELKWHGTPIILLELLEHWAGFVMAGAAGVFLLFAWIFLLRRTVKIKTRELREANEYMTAVFDSMNDIIFVDNSDGSISDVNRRFQEVYGYTKEEVRQMNVGQLSANVEPYTQKEASQWLQKAKEIGPQTFAWMARNKQGVDFPVQVNVRHVEILGAERFLVSVQDITTRKEAEHRQQMVVEILSILNSTAPFVDVISAILQVIKRELHMDAVGIRLRIGEDVPYYAQEGFSEDFLRTENSLCAQALDGRVQRDADGKVVLECTCGLVLSGRTDPASPFFSPGGSFWSNDTTRLLGLEKEHDPRANPRDRCIHEGYRSVALIPIRVDQEIVGLLQLNDHQPGRFSADFVSFLEGVSASVGVALSRRRDLDNLQTTNDQLEDIIEFLPDATLIIDKDKKIIAWNRAIEQMTGVKKQEVLGKDHAYASAPFYGDARPYLIDLLDKDDDEIARKYNFVKRKGSSLYGEAFASALYNGKGAHIWAIASPFYDNEGNRVGAIESIRDITEHRHAQKLLQQERDTAQRYLDTAGVLFVVLDPEGVVTLFNKKGCQILGYEEQEILGKNWFDVCVPKEERQEVKEIHQKMMGGDVAFTEHHENYVLTKQGEKRLLAFYNTLIFGKQGDIVGVLSSGEDVTERQQAVESLAKQHNLLRTLIDNLPDSVYVKDPHGRKILTNRADIVFIGAKNESDVLGKTDAEVFPKHLANQYVRDDNNVLHKGIPVINREELVENISGEKYWLLTSKIPLKNEQGDISGLVGIGRDITERKLLETKLLTMAHYDTLTQLPNRTLFMEKASLGLAHAKRTGMSCAVLFVDLDHFKSVNDTLGHSVGDELLKDTALKLGSCIRETDIMARLGGDEFIILLNDLESGQGAQYTAERIREQLNVPRIVSGNDLFITASTGIAVYPNDGDSLEELLKNADTAMYAAKESGRNMYCFFDFMMNKNAVTKMQVERGLRDALVKNEMALFYQPIVNVKDGKIRGFEALLRWFRTEGGLVFPDEFIPVAEETGLIIPIGEWVIHEACRFNKKLVDAGHTDMIMSVNISVAQLRRKNLVDIIKSALDQSGLRPELLEIEVTESLFIESFEVAIDGLNAIRALGVKVSLDDFGTGYSSLVHLQKLPIVNLKIDRLFIKEIAKDSDENAMIPAIIDMAHKLKLGVIAEGVETSIQLEKLFGNCCDYYQGYFFSKPMPADQVLAFLEHARDPGRP